MPSLKDLRNRIAATKATQKITKAMQMVAASKLRRAQAAAEAARPYAARMDTVLGNIAASVAAMESAPRLLRGTGSDQKHLLLVCTAERGLCGPFNTAIVRLARERANALIAEGHPVGPRWITDEELAAKPELVRTMSVKPPSGMGRVRLMEISGVDLQPCGGTHVRNTAEIGQVAVTKIENKGKQNRRVILAFAE